MGKPLWKLNILVIDKGQATAIGYLPSKIKSDLNVRVGFYFAGTKWTSTFTISGRLPIRMGGPHVPKPQDTIT